MGGLACGLKSRRVCSSICSAIDSFAHSQSAGSRMRCGNGLNCAAIQRKCLNSQYVFLSLGVMHSSKRCAVLNVGLGCVNLVRIETKNFRVRQRESCSANHAAPLQPAASAAAPLLIPSLSPLSCSQHYSYTSHTTTSLTH